MAASGPLRLAMVITADAKGVAPATAEARQELMSVGQAAQQTSSIIRMQAAANDEAAAAQRRAADAARGRAVAEREMQQAVAQFAGIKPITDDAGMRQRAADIEAYASGLDDLRAKYNPLFAAERLHRQNLAGISQAQRLGAISADEAAAATQRANIAFQVQNTLLASGRNVTALQTHEVANLSFQLTDMAVMLASGQSPWLIMVQQGAQAAQIMGPRGFGSLLPAVAAGLRGMVNPTMLALGGFTALGYAASYVFDAMQGDIEDANETIEDHLELIDSVARRWGNAIPGLKAYNDELQRTKDIEDALKALRFAASEQYTPVRNKSPDLQIDIADLVDQLERAGADYKGIRRIQEEFEELRVKIANNTATAQDAIDVQDAINGKLGVGIPIIKEYSDSFGQLAKEIGEVNAAARKFDQFVQDGAKIYGPIDPRTKKPGESYLNPLNPLDGFNQTPFQTPEDMWAERARREREAEENKRLGALVPIPTRRPNLEDSLPSIRNLITTQEEQLEKLRLERSLIGASSAEREKAIALLEAEQEIRRAGIDVNGGEAERYRRGAVAIAEQTTELERNAEAWKKAQTAAESMIDNALGRLASGDWKGALEGLAKDILKQVTTLSANSIKNDLYGTDYPTLDSYGGVGGWVKALLGGRPAAPQASQAFQEQGGGLLGLLGAGRAQDPIIRLPLAAPASSRGVGSPLAFVGNYKQGVDPDLTMLLKAAAGNFSPYKVEAFSGYRPGDPRFHGEGLATDVRLIGPQGALPSYQNAASFRAYESFAQQVYKQAQSIDPDLAGRLRWGGYFSGGKGKYGAADLMHFDLAGDRAGMGGGSWAGGLNAKQRALWPNAESIGLGQLDAKAKTSAQALDILATKSIDAGAGAEQLAKSLTSMFPGAPGAAQGGGGGWGSLFSMVGNFLSPSAWSVVSSGRMTGLFDDGGYTGDGDLRDAAGIVHRGEYVLSAPATRALGVENLDRLHRIARNGYANGGLVVDAGAPMPASWRAAGSSPAAMPAPKVEMHIHNNAGVEIRKESREDGRGGMREDIYIEQAVARAINRPGSAANHALEQRGARAPLVFR